VVVSRGASYLTLQTVVTTIAQVVTFAILARIITTSEVGILAILSLITALCQAINGSAFQQATIKYVGEFTGDREELAAGVFYQTLRISLIWSLPIAAFIFLGSGLLAQSLTGTLAWQSSFNVLAIDVLAYSGVLPVAIGGVLGMKRFKVASMIGIGGAVLRQVLIILLILFMRNFVGLAYAWAFSDYAMLAAYGLYVVRILHPSKGLFPLRKLLAFSWPLSVGNIASFAYSWFDRGILIAFVSLASLGVYNAALTAFAVLGSISAAFANALLPVYSDIRRRRGLEGCRMATKLASRYASLVMVPLSFGLLAIAKPALTLFVGQAYVSGAEPLMILSITYALVAFSLGLGPMLVALSETRFVMGITLTSVVFGIASAYILLPFTGIIGASIARGVALVVSVGLTLFVLRKGGAMSIDIEAVWKSLVAGAVMAIVLVAMQLIIYSRLFFPLYVLIGAVVYVMLLRGLNAVRKHDIELIEKYLGPRLSRAATLLKVILISASESES